MRADTYDLYGDRLYARACAIEDNGAVGWALPIWKALAVRGNPEAQVRLADILSDKAEIGLYRPKLGRIWYQRAGSSGSAAAHYNLAIDFRNRNKLGSYRYWLARSARIDKRDLVELRQFKTRFGHRIMKKWHRYNALADPYA